MSNGARHALGFLAGLILTAAIGGLLIYGTYKLQVFTLHKETSAKWIAMGMLAGAAVVFGVLSSSRVSPIGSLVGGLLLGGFGVLAFTSAGTTRDIVDKLPFEDQRPAVLALEGTGVFLIVGVALLAGSLFPSRWQSLYEDENADYEPVATATQHVAPSGYGGAAYETAQPTSYGPATSIDYGRSPFSPPDEGM